MKMLPPSVGRRVWARWEGGRRREEVGEGVPGLCPAHKEAGSINRVTCEYYEFNIRQNFFFFFFKDALVSI